MKKRGTRSRSNVGHWECGDLVLIIRVSNRRISCCGSINNLKLLSGAFPNYWEGNLFIGYNTVPILYYGSHILIIYFSTMKVVLTLMILKHMLLLFISKYLFVIIIIGYGPKGNSRFVAIHPKNSLWWDSASKACSERSRVRVRRIPPVSQANQ